MCVMKSQEKIQQQEEEEEEEEEIRRLKKTLNKRKEILTEKRDNIESFFIFVNEI